LLVFFLRLKTELRFPVIQLFSSKTGDLAGCVHYGQPCMCCRLVYTRGRPCI